MTFQFKAIKTVTCFLFIIFFGSCSNVDNVIVIHPLDSDYDLFSISVIKSIQLSNQDEALIGSIDKLLQYKNYLYVLDKKKTSSLLIFNLDGTLEKRIPRGKGPGEIVDVENFDIINEMLVISDQFQMKYYSLNGQFDHSIKLPEGWFAWSIIGLDNSKVLLHGSASLENSIHPTEFAKYHIVDNKFSKCFNSYYSINREYLPFIESQPACYYNGRILISGRPDSYIYEIDGTNFKKKYFVDFVDFNFSESDIDKGRENFFRLYKNGKRFGLLDNIIENKSIIHFIYGAWFGEKGHAVPIVYSKEHNKSARFNDLLENEGLPKMSISHGQDEKFICFFQPTELSDEEIQKINSSRLFESEITCESNPIIVVVEVIIS
ncbi:MAG: 6-bladed beta-propeller [Bacteroidota bacterium]|nr:6-bladed beta-propeller [Bacteroidota bacterium]